jgi:predicted regulator of Ras-like GTPase activity (Roadblock/LC7/MglB family)/CheY-like chemotaxis protein
MVNRILLVDDEKSLLEGLKRNLNHLSNIFETDICDSVYEAIRRVETKEYNLIISDIRMPHKGGLDLLLHLKAINFSGSIKVMSAYTEEEYLNKIKALGIIDVISKPFDLKWFQDMLINLFEKEKETSMAFESIDLLSVMQVLNMDRKNSALQINVEGKKGIIYFKEGNIIHAEYENVFDEEAVLQLINLEKGIISLKKIKKNVKRTIKKDFVDFCAEIIKELDDLKKNERENSKKNLKINKKREVKMAKIKDVLSILKEEITGLQAASVFGRDGIPIAIENPANLDVDAFSEKFAIVCSLVSKSIKDLSGGTVSQILIEEEKGRTLIRPIGQTGLSLFIAVTSEATLGNVRLVAKRLEADLEKTV